MNYMFLTVLLGFSTLFGEESTCVVGWQELPRISLFDRGKAFALESLASSLVFLWMGTPRWTHALLPSLGVCALGPSVVRGLILKKKMEQLRKPRFYDPHNFTDPVLYVTCFLHPLDHHSVLTSAASIVGAFNDLDEAQKKVFAQGLLCDLDYASCQEALCAVSLAKNYRRLQLQDLKQYSDIEDRLHDIVSSLGAVSKQYDQWFYVDPLILQKGIEDVLDSGVFRQEISFNSTTKRLSKLPVSGWYEDDFVYYYASWYGFELLQAYGRLLALEQVWQSLGQAKNKN